MSSKNSGARRGNRGGSDSPLRLHRVQLRLQGVVALEIAELALVVGDALRKLRPEVVVVALPGDLPVQFLESLAEFLVRLLPAGEPDHAEPRGQVSVGGEIVEGGDQLAVRQVARRAENDEKHRIRGGCGG